jgi:hypothetical protein
MRHLPRVLPGAALAALILCLASVTATADGRGNGNGNGHGDGYGHDKDNSNSNVSGSSGNGNAAPTATTPAAPTTPPGPATKTPATTTTTTTPATGDTQAQSAEPTPVPPAVPPVIGRSMGLKPVGGTVQVRLPRSSGYVSLASAGSIPSGAVVDARQGTVQLSSAVDASGRTQTATMRGAIFEIRQSATGKGMTDLVLRDGPPQGCPATGSVAMARAATTHSTTTKAKPGSGGLWAQDRHGRFRTRGGNSVATVRGTRWVTRETCAGTLTRVMEGTVDVFDLHKHRTVRVRAGHSYLARTSA